MSDILSSKFIKKYKSEMIRSMKSITVGFSEEEIESVLDDMIRENIQEVPVTLDNNYLNVRKETTLLGVFDWILVRKPIIAGNGTFYKNQDEAINPIAQMLDNFASSRKAFKKQMFKIEDTSSYEYQELDRSQLNEKINMNSWYGGSGAPSAAFYSKWSGPATTLSAQSVISTATAMFDAFLGDNQYFIDFDELSYWVFTVLDEFREEEKSKIEKWIIPATREELFERLNRKMLSEEDDVEITSVMIRNIIDSMSDDEVTYLFYKNNMVTFFIRHKYIENLFIKILSSCNNYPMLELDKKGNYLGSYDNWIDELPKEFKDEYRNKRAKDWNSFVSKEYFMDPNEIPETIKDEVMEIKRILMKYIFVKYLSFDRIYRLRNFKRRAAVIIDTDSNILTLDIIMGHIMDNIIGEETFGRPQLYNVFLTINTLTATITEAIKETLLFYGKQSNIPEAHRPRFDMKNEFFMSPVIIGDSKKRYISKILLREGNLMNPAKIDVKGFDFKKSTCSEYAEDYFMGLIKKYIIESPTIDILGMYRGVRAFEEEIKESIRSGDNKFLPNASVKELYCYANPASEQSVRGYLAWNFLNPDNPIEAPAKVSLVKMNIFTLESISDLEHTNPDVYQIIKEKIFNDKTGIFVSSKKIDGMTYYASPNDVNWRDRIPSKYKSKFKNKTAEEWNTFMQEHGLDTEDKSRGLQVLAIPRNGKIPEWALPYVDMTTMVNTIISPFKPVMKLFGNQTAVEGKATNKVIRSTEKITNIVKF